MELPNNIAFFGSSSVYGEGDFEGGYVGRFKKWYQNIVPFSRIYNLGIPGETTRQLVNRFGVEANHRQPNLVIFQIGTNDAHHQSTPDAPLYVSPNEFKANVENLFGQAKEYGSVIVLSAFPIDESKNPRGEGKDAFYYNKNIDTYEQDVKSIAEEFNIKYIDLWSDLINSDKINYLSDDGLHLDQSGYKIYADRLIEYFTDVYSIEV